MNWVNIGSGNGLSPVQQHTITSTNVDLLSIGSLGTSLKFELKYKTFIHENIFENVICKMVAILSRGEVLKVLYREENSVLIWY